MVSKCSGHKDVENLAKMQGCIKVVEYSVLCRDLI